MSFLKALQSRGRALRDPPEPKPVVYSITEELIERFGSGFAARPDDRQRSWAYMGDVVFPLLVSKVRSGFMLDINFSAFQWKMFQKWVRDHGMPVNLHVVRWEEQVGLVRGPDGWIDTRRFIVRLMDIKWVWELCD